MKTYTYRATIERGDERDWVVSFPDVPEAVSQAETVGGAREAAREALGLALLSYPARNRALPRRSFGLDAPPSNEPDAVEIDVSVSADVTAKLAVIEACRSSGRSPADLAHLLGRDASAVARIVDPMHPTDVETLSRVLEALGQRLVVGVAAIDEAA